MKNIKYFILILLILVFILLFNKNNPKIKDINVDFHSYDVEVTTELDGSSIVFINEKEYHFENEEKALEFQKNVFNLDKYTYLNADKEYELFLK